MEQTLDFIARHGASVILVVAFLNQLGLPIPAIPFLLAFGALAGQGRLDPVPGLLLATAASVCADLVWFQLGRWKGTRVLGFLCRIALEPDTCVSKTRDLFAKYGAKSLLVAKFVPGLDTVAPPLAGLLGVRVVPFALWAGAGAFLWATAFGGVGYLFSNRLDELAGVADRLGGTLALVVLGLLGAYLAWKYVARQRILRSIRMERITPDELHQILLSGRAHAIVDARSKSAQAALPFVIQGARLLSFEEIDEKHLDLSRETEVIVYCS
jgi:membrane protein DedA with SNARE-associated domain